MNNTDLELVLSDDIDVGFFAEHLLGCKDLDNMIIKSHILIEHVLNHFINKNSKINIDIGKSRFSFSDKVEIAGILGLFENNVGLMNEVKSLNKLRNSIAHKLRYDPKSMNDFLKILDTFDLLKKQLKNDNEITIKTKHGESYKVRGVCLSFIICISYLYGKISTTSIFF